MGQRTEAMWWQEIVLLIKILDLLTANTNSSRFSIYNSLSKFKRNPSHNHNLSIISRILLTTKMRIPVMEEVGWMFLLMAQWAITKDIIFHNCMLLPQLFLLSILVISIQLIIIKVQRQSIELLVQELWIIGNISQEIQWLQSLLHNPRTI